MTEAEILKIHREELDRKWLERYPIGRYCVQVWNAPLSGRWYGIHFTRRRPTPRIRYPGLTVMMRENSEGITVTKWQNNSFGRCTYYADLDSAIKGAIRRGLPDKLIALFKQKMLR